MTADRIYRNRLALIRKNKNIRVHSGVRGQTETTSVFQQSSTLDSTPLIAKLAVFMVTKGQLQRYLLICLPPQEGGKALRVYEQGLNLSWSKM